MPRKPKKPCRYPGCPKLTDESYCAEHAKLSSQQYEKYDRDPVAKRRYGRMWRKIRSGFIAKHPLCEECKKAGRLTKATEVHHILPLSRGGNHDADNLMALCKPCHSKITVELGDRWRKNSRERTLGCQD